ncbi:hypothetical protein D9613_009822 [Agrocybe pediades]|uniref:Uncharacterized protein n=1 Tax=Agrocybe pediades TaxID=84607 RepID=A0A8H4QWQ0_9AGAR|nr:hypothetical protein D9613_009823 [Agrocybe pediades]KAF4618920.1 hypothetical protein D9613_009822 [Agrocybe pediades]
MSGQLAGKITGKSSSLNGLFKDDSGPDREIVGKFNRILQKDFGEISAKLTWHDAIPDGPYEVKGVVGPTTVILDFYRPGSGWRVASVEGSLPNEIEPFDVFGTAEWQVKE